MTGTGAVYHLVFPNGISKREIYIPCAPFFYFQAFCHLFVPVEMSVGMEHAHLMKISIWVFGASHLLQYSTNWFFQFNGKQPGCHLKSPNVFYIGKNWKVMVQSCKK